MIMYTFSGSIILSILLLSLNGLSGHPIGERSARETSSRNPVNIQNVNHERDECTPARQAEQDNTHDIACILDTFEPFIDSLYQQVSVYELQYMLVCLIMDLKPY